MIFISIKSALLYPPSFWFIFAEKLKASMATSKGNDAKKELAYLLYMAGEQQKDIAIRIGVSPTTMTKWAEKGGWKQKRAASTITRGELINKTLMQISQMLEGNSADLNADKLSKLASLIERLDKKSSPVMIIEAFIEFGKWIRSLAESNRDLDLPFIQKLTRYQDLFVTEKMNLQ